MDPNDPSGGPQPGWVPPPSPGGWTQRPGPWPPQQQTWAPEPKRKRFGWGALIAAFLVGGVISAIVVVVGLVLLALAFGTPDSIAGTHPPIAEGQQVAKVGDCLEREPGSAVVADRSGVVDCDARHGSEVAAVVETPGTGRRPGHDDLATFADDACSIAFRGYVGSDPDDSQFDYAAIVPSASAWSDGDRTIWCVVDTTSLGPGDGSARGTHR